MTGRVLDIQLAASLESKKQPPSLWTSGAGSLYLYRAASNPSGFFPFIPLLRGRPCALNPEFYRRRDPRTSLAQSSAPPLSAATGRQLPRLIGQSPREALTARNPFSVNTSDTREICKPPQARRHEKPKLTNGEAIAIGGKKGGGFRRAFEVTPGEWAPQALVATQTGSGLASAS